jgi:hypothetical protein
VALQGHSFKRPPMKKEAIPEESEGVLFKRAPMEKEAIREKREGARSKDL